MAAFVMAVCCAAGHAAWNPPTWQRALIAARDGQNTDELRRRAESPEATDGASAKAAPADSSSDFRRALAYSYLSEVYLEKGDKAAAAEAAKAGIAQAREALRQKPADARRHWLLGTLCGQVIPANVFSGLSFGQCARDEVEAALRLDPQLPEAHLARGVGNYYLPPAFGGGLEKAEADFRRVVDLAPGWADGHLWLGLTRRRQSAFADARKHLGEARRLAPGRQWIQVQLDKTPAAAAAQP
jgi:hypothetical protein